MATTKHQIYQWLIDGDRQHATHVIIVCDSFDWEDYPVFVAPQEDARTVANQYGANDCYGFPTLVNKNMQKVMEVYSLSGDWNAQLNEFRAFHFD